jgi:hypothetical protein
MRWHVGRDLTVDDFVTGLLAALACRGVRVISIRGEEFYEAMARAYQALETIAGREGIEPRFAVFLDPLHGDSPVVREAISAVVVRDLASLDNPEYQDLRLKIFEEQATMLLQSLPGGPSLYERIAEAFIQSYPYVNAAGPDKLVEFPAAWRG